MKIFKFFPLACAALMMSACSSDDGNGSENPNIASEAQYLAVNIVNVGTTPTRALDGTYEDGSDEESKINKIRFYFFNSDGSPYILAGTTDPNVNWLEKTALKDGKDTPNGIEQITKSILVIKGVKNSAPSKMIAIVNPGSLTSTTLGNDKKTLAELTNPVVDSKFNVSTATGSIEEFVMSNSVYATSEKATICENSISGYVATDQATAEAKPVDIYVERVSAKVKATLTGTNFIDGAGRWGTGKSGIKVGECLNHDIYAVVDGWGVADENTKANLVKQIDANWTSLGFTPWTTADYHRSFWETSVAFAAATNVCKNYTFNQFKKQPNEFLYTLPNTSATAIPATSTSPTDPTKYKNDRTKFLLTAHLMYDAGAAGWQNAELCTYKGVDYLGVDNLKKHIALESGYYVETAPGAKTYQRITAADITFKKAVGEADYLVVPTIDDTKTYYQNTGSEASPHWTPVTGTAANTALANETAQVRTEGKTYYFIPIKHLGTDNTIAEYGIVRNHIYDVKVNNIAGFGTPVCLPDEVIIPTMPEDQSTYLAARINVLQWRVVTQSVDLGK